MTANDTTLAATVAICTRNRADSLARTLTSIVKAARSVSAPWELLVVNNGSTDHTDAVVASFATRLPIRSIYEPLAGLSNARNAAIDNARGVAIIWTDDDLTVDAGWLNAYLTAFHTWPEHSIFGGRAVPLYERPKRAWFVDCERDLESLLAIRDATDWDEITADRVPYGLNYAVRTNVQRVFRYDPDLGVAPGRRLGGEETTMIRAALNAGMRGRWVWDATVHHIIPAERQTAAYVFSYYRAHGYRFPDLMGKDSDGLDLPLLVRIAALVGRKGAMTAWRRVSRNPAWVRSFISLARAMGTLDRRLSNAHRSGHHRAGGRAGTYP